MSADLPDPMDIPVGQLVTLHLIAAEPANEQYQRQWSGRLQGMAMRGLVWRFSYGPWRPSAYGRYVIAATSDHERIVEMRRARGEQS